MNRARVAALLRELADELESSDDVCPPSDRDAKPEKPRPKRLRRRAIPRPPGPLQPPTDIDMIRAKAMLRRRGITP